MVLIDTATLSELMESHLKAELSRLKKLCIFEEKARLNGYRIIAGIDEAGRGPLAGPVVAAACILPEGMMIEGVNDSKQLLPPKRRELYELIISQKDILYAIGIVDIDVIDTINILQATFLAMKEADKALSVTPDCLLIDGSFFPSFDIPTEAIVQGDGLSQSIAAASIIAKEIRDQLMRDYHQQWPMYGFAKHKGYATKEHMQAIKDHGPSPIHRKSFEPIKSLLLNI